MVRDGDWGESQEEGVPLDSDLIEVFYCNGIGDLAVQMRRRVQLGMVVEFLGTQVSNLMMAHAGRLDFSTYFVENSNAVVALHIYAVWKYAGFLRDALMARHVTRIALVQSPGVEALLGVGLGSATEASQVSDGTCPAHIVELIVETGPWQRRVKLVPVLKEGEIDEVTFGQMLRAGLLHIDLRDGHVVNARALDCLRDGRWKVAAEEVTTDVLAAGRAFIDPEKMAGFMSDGADGEYIGRLLGQPWLQPILQGRGGRAFQWGGMGALAMGFGSAFVWCSRR